MSVKSLICSAGVGAVLRTFAIKAEDVPKRVEAMKEMVDKLRSVLVEGAPVFKQINILVWEHYQDADCGHTAEALRSAFKGYRGVQVSEFATGDLFCGILNYGIMLQTLAAVRYTLIASTEAVSYVNNDTVRAMLEAVDKKAVAAGVAINELTESVMAGRLANTMCLWDNVALMSVGGFDLRAAKPVDDKSAHYMKGADKSGKPVFYQLAGVEEVIPLARLVEAYGPCIAPILPSGDGVQQYQVPDPVTQSELYQRHVAKMGTKTERQIALLASVGYDLSFLKGGVIQK